ncbi:MAG: GNAT family protein [Patescibacteria group bacterium]
MSHYSSKINALKKRPKFVIKVGKIHSIIIFLRVINNADVENKILIKNIALWRRREAFWFGDTFKVTVKRTKKWLKDLVIDNQDRILFAIEDEYGRFYGHLGFYRYRRRDNSCELDNVVRGLKNIPGLMTTCVTTLVSWGFKNLNIDRLYLITFNDNVRAVNLYKRCGFKTVRKIPLMETVVNGDVKWVKLPKSANGVADRSYVRMVNIGHLSS